MHGCEDIEKEKKRRNVGSEVADLCFSDQPRSAFCFSMEEFQKKFGGENAIEVCCRGFEAWKRSSDKERQQYVDQAEKVNVAHEAKLLQECDDMLEIDDEADSATVAKFDQLYGNRPEDDDFTFWQQHLSSLSFDSDF